MIRLFKSALPARIAVALALTALATSALAQAMPSITNTNGRIPGAPPPTTGAGPPPLAPPPALPGARSQQGLAVPSDRSANAMSPNDSLFDAINRGDLADARDAITRGADLDARNVLGLTPIDLSIDLGRNDITFLVMSLRGGQSSGRNGAGGAAKAGAAAAHAVKPLPGSKAPPVSKPLPVSAARHPPATTLVAARSPAADPAPRPPVSSDPGTPAPQAGFLGFGGAPRQ